MSDDHDEARPGLCWLLVLLAPASAAPITPDDVRVMDGDTIRVYHHQPNVRLVGFNAPETVRAACDAERALGDRATRRVRDLVRDGHLDFEFVACSCPAGTEGTPACNYGRRYGRLKGNGQDIGAILIAEGLALPFQCGATRCPPTPRPWCEGHRTGDRNHPNDKAIPRFWTGLSTRLGQ